MLLKSKNLKSREREKKREREGERAFLIVIKCRLSFLSIIDKRLMM